MSKLTKTAKTVLKIGTGVAGTYLGLGGLLYFAVLGRPTLNKGPEEALRDPSRMRRYVNDPLFREADDWFMANMPSEKLITDKNGDTLHAEMIMQSEESHLWAILVHGFTSRPRTMANQGIHYYKQGFNTLFPYQRGHRNSEHKYCSMGYFERYDILEWINYIVSLDPKAQIVLHGCSMGAATVMLTLGEQLPENVKCAVEDCGYTDCYSQFKEQIGNIAHLPPFPFLNGANTFSKLFCGWDFKDCTPIEAVKRSKTPTLFIHGELDDFVPYAMEKELYLACNSEKEILSVPDAEHDKSCEVHPELYWEKADSFVKKYMDIK